MASLRLSDLIGMDKYLSLLYSYFHFEFGYEWKNSVVNHLRFPQLELSHLNKKPYLYYVLQMISFLIVRFIKSFYRFYFNLILFIFILIAHFNSHSTKMQNLFLPSILNREDNLHNVM